MENKPHIDPLINYWDDKKAVESAKSLIEQPAAEDSKQTPRITENLIGDSKNSLFTKFEDQRIRYAEQEAIESADKANEEYVAKIDNYLGSQPKSGTSMTPEEMRRSRSRPLFSEPPYNQDEEKAA